MVWFTILGNPLDLFIFELFKLIVHFDQLQITLKSSCGTNMLYIQNFMYSSHLKKCKYINVGPCPESPFVSRDYKGWRVFTDSLNGAKWSKKLQSEWKTEKSCRTQCGIEEASIFFDVFYNIWNLWNMFSQLMGKTDSHWQYVLFYSRDAWRTGDLAVTAAKRKPSLCSAPASRGRKNPRHIAHWTEMSVRRSKCWGFTLS